MTSSNPILQSGVVTPGHAAVWTTDGVVMDGGSAADGNLFELGLVNNGNVAIAINSANPDLDDPYTQLGLAVSSDGQATLSVEGYGGAPGSAFQVNIDGTNYPFPGSYVASSVITQLPNIASLRNSSTTSLPQGVVYVVGYYGGADGGEGTFWDNTADTVSSDNGGTIIVDASGRRWYRETNNQPYAVKWFGARGDGVTNDTAAFNAAAAALGLGGGTVLMDVSNFLIDPIVLPRFVSLCGNTPGPFDPTEPPTGTTSVSAPTLIVNSTATAFITTAQNTTLGDFQVWYPQQVPPTAMTPNVYPPTILVASTGNMRGITLINSYVGVSITIGRFTVDNCKIGALQKCILVEDVSDVIILTRLQCGVFWDTVHGLVPPQNLDNWSLNNGIAYDIGRADGLIISDVTCFWKQIGIQFRDTTDSGGPPTSGYAKCVNMDFDTVQYGVVASSTDNTGGGVKLLNMDVGLWGTGAGNAGQAALFLASGGEVAPEVTWIGGSVRGTPASGTTAGFVVVSNGSAYVSNIRGYNPIGHTGDPAVPASGVAYQWTGPYNMNVTIQSFHITNIQHNGVSVGGAGDGQYTLLGIIISTNDTIAVTYTGSNTVTWQWFGL